MRQLGGLLGVVLLLGWGAEVAPLPGAAAIARDPQTADSQARDSQGARTAPQSPGPTKSAVVPETQSARSMEGSEATREIKGLGGRLLAAGSSPSWSPNGKSIVYCHGNELQILDIESGRSRRLVPSGRSPAWSPGDGRYVAFVCGEEGAEEVCLCKAAGGPPQRLAAGKDPRWSLDGGTVYYATKKNEYYAIGVGRPGPATLAADRPGDLPARRELPRTTGSVSPGSAESACRSSIAKQGSSLGNGPWSRQQRTCRPGHPTVAIWPSQDFVVRAG